MRGATPQPAYGTAAGRTAPNEVSPGTYKHVGYESAPVQRVVQKLLLQRVHVRFAMDQFARVNGPAGSAPGEFQPVFDSAGFLTAAKANYVKLQQAWDSEDLAELSEFTSNDMLSR